MPRANASPRFVQTMIGLDNILKGVCPCSLSLRLSPRRIVFYSNITHVTSTLDPNFSAVSCIYPRPLRLLDMIN